MNKNEVLKMLEQWPEDLPIISIRLNIWDEMVIETPESKFYLYSDDELKKFKGKWEARAKIFFKTY